MCQECIDVVLNVEKFALRCASVNKMFLELANGSYADDAIESVRDRYGLGGSYEYINCETSQFEAKPEPISSESGKIPNRSIIIFPRIVSLLIHFSYRIR